jgi:acetoacetate decarboxylase
MGSLSAPVKNAELCKLFLDTAEGVFIWTQQGVQVNAVRQNGKWGRVTFCHFLDKCIGIITRKNVEFPDKLAINPVGNDYIQNGTAVVGNGVKFLPKRFQTGVTACNRACQSGRLRMF